MVRREPSLIGLVASEEVHFVEASSTCIVDNGGEQDGRGIPPAAIGEPGALIQAHPARHLERRHGRDHQVVVPEFVDDRLIGRAAPSESGREAIEDGKEAGATSPLGLVELAQDVETLEDGPASDRLMRHAFGREALGADTEVLAELRGQGGPVRLWAVGQGREGSHNHGLAANVARQGFDQPRPGPDAFEVQEALTRTTEPVPEEADHRRFVAGGGKQVEMIRAERAVSHHPDAKHRVASLQGETTEEVRPVDDQKEVAARSTGPGQPPRSQEGRRKWGRIHQLIPLRSPPVEVGDVEQAGRSH